jgi:predicted HTH domain antitoxin
MDRTVSVRLPTKTLREVDRVAKWLKTNRSVALRRFVERGLREERIDLALDLLREAKVSMGRAAELAGVTLREMIGLAREHRIPSGYELEDLEMDLSSLGLHR